jgi:cation transport ATPase
LLTRSLGRTFEALLLVNPRTAIIGMEAANLGAWARLLRAGATVVGTRPERVPRRPDVLLLDGPRVLTDGLEVASALPLHAGGDEAELLSLAAGLASSAGCPWGDAFAHACTSPALEAHFDGTRATATVGGVRYTLGPADAARAGDPATAGQRGVYWLLLDREGGERPLAAFALRPRLAAGVAELVEACRRHEVRLELFAGGDEAAAGALARRARVPLAPAGGVLARVRALQRQGLFVAFVSDHAEAAPAFAACDLAVARSSGESGHFAARADLLAGDLGAVTAVVEAGVRRDAAVRDAVLFSAAANLFGAAWGLAPEGVGGRPGVLRASRAVYVTALGAMADGCLRLWGGRRLGPSLAAGAEQVVPTPDHGDRATPDPTPTT